MKVLLAPIGTRGDVQPVIALGLALSSAGHHVTVCAAENYSSFVREYGLNYVRGGRDTETMVRERGDSLRNPLALMRAGQAMFEEQFDTLHGVCPDADIMIGTSLLVAGPTIAEQRGIPFYWGIIVPNSLPTSELPPPFGFRPRESTRLQRLICRLLWKLMGGMSNLFSRDLLNRRRAPLGLPPIADVYAYLLSRPVLFAVDQALAQPPSDWPGKPCQTGSWILNQTAPLPSDIEHFIDDGPPPVYIGFGSMPSDDPVARTKVIVDAVVASQRRALLSSGWAKLGDGTLPASCKVVGSVNHQRLFPKMAAVVHHGGAGTTATAARAGVPQVIVPHALDQPYWAARMQALGVAPPPVPKNFSARTLAAAIRQAANDADMAKRAQALSEQLRTTDGAASAVRFLESQHSTKR